jgi:DNA mismatch endonuclease, patch repair protein
MTATVLNPVAKDPATSARLGSVRQHGTEPELTVRKALHRLGYRYRTNGRQLPGRPDIVNRAGRWAIFVHGCFWHHHAGCRRATIPKNNTSFWIAKFAANKARDRRSVLELKDDGFAVLTLWECEVLDELRLHRTIARFFLGLRRKRKTRG